MRLQLLMQLYFQNDITLYARSNGSAKINVYLENGDCQLNDFLGNASIKTKHGNIKVHARENVSGRAFSTNGSVVNYLPGQAKYTIIAESRDGDISLLQTK